MNSEQLRNDVIRLGEPHKAPIGHVRDTEDASAISLAADSLLRIAALAEEFGVDRISADAGSAAQRIAEGRFYVACVGQFKRGKSTLLNALIGEAILPCGVVPVTAVPRS